MAGIAFQGEHGPVFMDFADDYGEAIVNGRKWTWEFHRYCGPLFLKKDGEPKKVQPSGKHAVWKAFDHWLKKRDKSKG